MSVSPKRHSPSLRQGCRWWSVEEIWWL